MKFSSTQENLHQGLMAVTHIANKNINLPILGNVLVKSDDKVLRLTATNLEIAVSCAIRGKIDENGEFTVPSRLFSDYVSLLPKERVDIALDGNAFLVSCGPYQTKLNGVSAAEFPLIPSIERKQRFVIKINELRRAIGQVLFAVAPNESRPEISGVLFKFTVNNLGAALIMAATDSYRLAEKTVSLVKEKSATTNEPISVIVPSRTVAELMRILGVFKDDIGRPDEVEIFLSENQILFAYNDVEITSRTIEGKYPDYRQLIPDRFESEVILSRDELLRAVKTTSLFSRAGLNDVNFRFTPEKSVRLSAVNAQTGEHSVDLDGQVSGREMAITVNFKYFSDGVATIDSEAVKLQLNDGLSPCLIRPLSETPDYLYIVMPIRQ